AARLRERNPWSSMPDPLRILRRISAMSPAELADRLRDRASAELERLGRKLPTPAIPQQGFRKWLVSAPSERFYPGAHASNRTFIQKNFPQWIDRAVEQAESICRHQFQLLAMDRVTLAAAIDWHQDPYSSRRWELKFWADYKPQD